MYPLSAQGVDERMINVHYYYYVPALQSLRSTLLEQRRWQLQVGVANLPLKGILALSDLTSGL